MKVCVLFSLFVVGSAIYVPFDSQLDEHWENFKKAFDKTYKGGEDAARRLIWEQNVARIGQHNLRADVGLHSYTLGLNEYADMSHKEFVKTLGGCGRPENPRINGSAWLPPANVQLPDKVDWRDEGLVTPVKNQMDCGSCWAFSATGSLEGQHKKKTGQLVSLSEQNLVDCSTANDGCNGGNMDKAFLYIVENGGIDTEESYPYTARVGTCHFNRAGVGATCSGHVDLPYGDEEALKTAVATVGPISVYIDASHGNFHVYRSGIYNEQQCSSSPEKLNHAVIVVGYGTEDGIDYWLVKNSWGTSWGMSGYIKMSRNKFNQCGIATAASYPMA